MTKLKVFTGLLFFTLPLLIIDQALAYDVKPWQMGMREAVTPVMQDIDSFHNLLLIIAIVISVFVMILLGIIIFRFNEKANPTPNRFSHNTTLEVLWTVVPVIILVLITIPSMRLLYFQDRVEEADMTLKIVGYQWYWGYEYPDYEGVKFESYIIPDDEIKKGQLRLLEVDNRVIVPVDSNIRLLVTAADVLHAWALPNAGVKIDAVPGRLNEGWMRIEKPGVYRGQCSELCGVNHGFMPIVIEAVSKPQFKRWINRKQNALSSNFKASGEKKLAELNLAN